MKNLQSLAIDDLQFWLVMTAALLVPCSQREIWLAEWASEFWYARRSCVLDRCDRTSGWRLTLFCLGAFTDANWIRRNQAKSNTKVFDVRSPLGVLFRLATLAVLTFLVALIVPGSRHALLPMPTQDMRNLAMVSTNHGSNNQQSSDSSFSVSIGQYRSWRNQGTEPAELAFYEPLRARIGVGRTKTESLQIARTTDNLFEVLELPLALPVEQGKNHLRSVVLSESTWHTYFASDPNTVGSIVEVLTERAMVVGIVPDASWRLPIRANAWLVEDKDYVDMYSTNRFGYVVARVSPSTFQAHPRGYWEVAIPTTDGGIERLEFVSPARLGRNDLHVPLSIFFNTFLLACLALPAITSVSLGHWSECAIPSKRKGIIPWFFLITKCVFMLPTVYFGTIILTHLGHAEATDGSQMLMSFASFLGFLFSFRWAFGDQRQRCPRCMRTLASPARVGQTSQSFLAWSGTELVCVNGHGLLHVPDFETSWFSKQRWLSLDVSWEGLFFIDSLSNQLR